MCSASMECDECTACMGGPNNYYCKRPHPAPLSEPCWCNPDSCDSGKDCRTCITNPEDSSYGQCDYAPDCVQCVSVTEPCCDGEITGTGCASIREYGDSASTQAMIRAYQKARTLCGADVRCPDGGEDDDGIDPADCNCHDDCGNCKKCSSAGVCEDDPACDDPLVTITTEIILWKTYFNCTGTPGYVGPGNPPPDCSGQPYGMFEQSRREEVISMPLSEYEGRVRDYSNIPACAQMLKYTSASGTYSWIQAAFDVPAGGTVSQCPGTTYNCPSCNSDFNANPYILHEDYYSTVSGAS